MNKVLTHPDHLLAADLCRQHQRLEWKIIEVLQRIGSTKSYREVGAPSLFQFALQFLGLTEPVAYNFIKVARKAREVPLLSDAIRKEELTVSRAGRIAAAVDRENAAHLIQFAKTHSWRQTEAEVARLNPSAARSESARAVSGDQVSVQVTLSKDQFALLKRAQDLLAQKSGRNANLSEAIGAALRDYVKKSDPVEKAKRATAKKMQNLRAHRVARSQVKVRRPLSADQRHAVFARDGGRCTFVDASGHRCTNERWVEVHHIRPLSYGGGNEPSNLTTLCGAHHDQVHQLSLPLEGQVTWLRSPVRKYTISGVTPGRTQKR